MDQIVIGVQNKTYLDSTVNKIIIIIFSGIFVCSASLFFGHQLIGPTLCNDGWKSPSLGIQGACSYHGGVNSLPELIIILASFISASVAMFFIHSLVTGGGRRPIFNENLGSPRRTRQDIRSEEKRDYWKKRHHKKRKGAAPTFTG